MLGSNKPESRAASRRDELKQIQEEARLEMLKYLRQQAALPRENQRVALKAKSQCLDSSPLSESQFKQEEKRLEKEILNLKCAMDSCDKELSRVRGVFDRDLQPPWPGG